MVSFPISSLTSRNSDTTTKFICLFFSIFSFLVLLVIINVILITRGSSYSTSTKGSDYIFLQIPDTISPLTKCLPFFDFKTDFPNHTLYSFCLGTDWHLNILHAKGNTKKKLSTSSGPLTLQVAHFYVYISMVHKPS